MNCPVRIQNVRRRTGGSQDKMSGEAQTNFAYPGFISIRKIVDKIDSYFITYVLIAIPNWLDF